jgi:hypothetical protein
MTGALEGLFGPRLELFDLYLTRSGWEAIDALTWVTVALSALASLLWWIFARGIYALVQRLLRGRVAASVKRWNKQKNRRTMCGGFALMEIAYWAAAVVAPPFESCIVTEEIWLPGEFSETDCVLPVVRSDRCAEK